MPIDPDWPVIRIDPRMSWGRPHIGGVSTEAIADLVMAAEDVATIVDNFDLERHGGRHAVLLACWWEAKGRFRRQWKTWADEVFPWLGGHRTPLDVDALPDPPTLDELGGSGKRKRAESGPA